ncbi:prolyl oligopeptidase family serine peptidase [candidate division CSSED10-310 bacterium]|uniref:Prolyl oligopeptidase family serine peptidase n=1 Tax=candidate division CSSED10-310 bacterium TaxID=2855610 RepID=A0ABV6YYC0_UNCC1
MSSRTKQLKPFRAEDFYQLKEVSNPQLSPDGKLIVYTLQEIDRVRNKYLKSLWLIDTERGKAKKFTSTPNGSDYAPQWSPDGKRIAFLSSRSGTNQLWLINIDGGEAQCFTDMKNGVEEFRWSPQGDQIAFISRMNEKERDEFSRSRQRRKHLDEMSLKLKREEEERKEKMKTDPRVVDRTLYRTGTSFRDDRRNNIFLIALKHKKITEIAIGDHDFAAPSWSADGHFIYSFANFSGDEDNNINTDIIKINVRSKEITRLTTDDDANSLPQCTAQGDYCVYLSLSGHKPSCKNNTIKVLDLNNPTNIVDVTVGFDQEIQDLQVAPDGEDIYFIASDRGSIYLYRVPLRGGIPEKLSGSRQFILDFHINACGTGITFTVSQPDIPSDVFHYSIRTGKIRRLTAINRKFLKTKYISQPEEIEWQSFDDKKIQGWIMKPDRFDESRKYPCIVEIHGGPHIMWGYSFWLEFQIMVAQDYVVFFCNPRGSEGYGTDFKGDIYQNWGDKDSKDILCGLDFQMAKGFIDPENLFLTGGSYGGFMTTWIIGHDDRFRAAVAQRGVYNLTSFYGCSDAQLLIEWEFDTFPWDNPELLWLHSPLAYAPMMKTPLLIIHSELDYRAPINTAEELFTALKKLKREVLFVRYPREGHELSRSGEPKHRVDRLQRIIGWFNQHRTNHLISDL